MRCRKVCDHVRYRLQTWYGHCCLRQEQSLHASSSLLHRPSFGAWIFFSIYACLEDGRVSRRIESVTYTRTKSLFDSISRSYTTSWGTSAPGIRSRTSASFMQTKGCCSRRSPGAYVCRKAIVAMSASTTMRVTIGLVSRPEVLVP